MGDRLIGSKADFYISSDNYLDLTRSWPASPSPESLLLETETTPLLMEPSKTALMVIDMQNFFLSPALGRKRGPGHDALKQLEQRAIPAARKAGIQVVWLNWGLTEDDIVNMPPAIKRVFGDPGVPVEARAGLAGFGADLSPKGGIAKDKRLYCGLGTDMGQVEVDGRNVDAGKILMRDQWNSALFPPLDRLYEEGRTLARKPDVWMHKDRMSGMWGATTMCQSYLEQQGLKTLLFAGVNTDQCVAGTLTDSTAKGFDCILLSDGCGTTSPSFAKECVEYNSTKSWGFVSDCESLAKSVARPAR